MGLRRSKIFAHISFITLFFFINGVVYGQLSSWSSLSTLLKSSTGLTSLTATKPTLTATKALIIQVPTIQTLDQLSKARAIACLTLAEALDTSLATNSVKNTFSDSIIKTKINDCFNATQALDAAFNLAWPNLHITSGSTDPMIVKDPLLLASMYFNHVFTKEFGLLLGAHTKGLPASCHNHMAAKQSFYRYVKAIINQSEQALQSPLSSFQSSLQSTSSSALTLQNAPITKTIMADLAEEILEEVATTSACMNRLEYAFFGLSWERAWDETIAKLDLQRATQIKPLLARLLTPIALLLYDVDKVNAENSPFYQWLKANQTDLQKAIQEKGWPDNKVCTYDRVDGSLLCFPPGKTLATQNCTSVDVDVLMSSLTDGRAQQDGSCSFAGEIYSCPQSLAGQKRYLCPRECAAAGALSPTSKTTTTSGIGTTSPSTGPSSSTSSISITGGGSGPLQQDLQQMQNRWPSLTSVDLMGMKDLCRPAGSLPPMGPTATTGDCSALTPQETPHDKYLKCTLEAAGGTTGATSLLTIPFVGEPTGEDCDMKAKISNAAGGATAAAATIAASEATAEATLSGWMDYLASLGEIAAEEAGAVFDAASVPVEAAKDALLGPAGLPNPNYPSHGIGEAGEVAQAGGGLLQAIGDILSSFIIIIFIPKNEPTPMAQNTGGTSGGTTTPSGGEAGSSGGAESKPQGSNAAAECMDDISCAGSGCSAMADILKGKDCTAEELSAELQAAGLAKPGISQTWYWDIRSNPVPDGETTGTGGADTWGDCLPGGAIPYSTPGGAPKGCDFVMCSGGLAVTATGGCCGMSSGSIAQAIAGRCTCGPGMVPVILPNGQCGECNPEAEVKAPIQPQPKPAPELGGFTQPTSTQLKSTTTTTQPLTQPTQTSPSGIYQVIQQPGGTLLK